MTFPLNALDFHFRKWLEHTFFNCWFLIVCLFFSDFLVIKMERLLAISLTEAEKAYIREKARDGVCKSQNGHECPLGRRNIHTELERQTTKVSFLVACTRLYKSLCRSVGWSVGRSVGRLVGWLVGRSVPLCFFCVFRLFTGREAHI